MNFGLKGHKPLAMFLASYAMILIMPVIIGFLVYEKTISLVREEVIDRNISLLEQNKMLLERRFAEIDTFVHQLMIDPRVDRFARVRDPYHDENTFSVIDTSQKLNDYSTMNSFILGYYILFTNSNLVISRNSVYTMEQFYEQLLHWHDIDFASWRSELLDRHHHRSYFPAAEATYKGKPVSIVSYVSSLGFENFSNGAILVLIDNRQIERLFEDLDWSVGGWAYLADGEGRVISSVSSKSAPIPPDPLRLDDRDGVLQPSEATGNMLVTYTTSSSGSNLKLVMAQPANVALQEVNDIRNVMFLLFVLLMTSICAYCLIAFLRGRPLRNVLMQISDLTGKPSVPFIHANRTIENHFARLLSDQKQLQVRLQEQIPFMRAAFLEQLLKGRYKSIVEIETLMNHAGVRIEGRHYAVAIVRLMANVQELRNVDLKELEIKKLLVREILGGREGYPFILHDVEEDKIALIVPLWTENPQAAVEELEILLEQVKEEMQKKQRLSPLIAVGEIYEDVTGIARSFQEAKEALHSRQWDIQHNNDIIWHLRLEAGRRGYYYPSDVELRLINLVLAGDSEGTDSLLREVFRMNAEIRLQPLMRNLLIYEIWGTAVRLTETASLDDDQLNHRIGAAVLELKDTDDLTESFQQIRTVFAELSETVRQLRKGQSGRLVQSIIGYIEQNYHRADLSLREVSEKFHISETYLSQLFKEQTGINYFEYVENIRMHHAKRLLLQTEMRIQSISVQLGYSSFNSFCRAFKRIHGISASVFRESRVE